jgi:putative inorganic carbon (HCO3(-)) transporter
VALFTVFVAWAGISASLSNSSALALSGWVVGLKLLVILFVALNALRTEKQIRYYLWLYLLCFMLSPGRGALQGYATENTVFGRAIWNYMYANPNDLAAYCMLAMGIALTLATSMQERKLYRMFAWASMILLVLIIFLTQSRGAMLAAVIAFGPLLLATFRKHRAALVYACVAAALVLYFVPQSAWDRFAHMRFLTSTETIAQADPEGSAENRYEIAIAAWDMTLSRPFVGSGPGTYIPTMGHDHPELGAKSAHNTYLELSAELGFPGLILWCAMVISVFTMAVRGRKTAAAAGIAQETAWIECAVLGFLIAGFFGSYAALGYLYLSLGLVWCRGAVLAEKARARAAAESVAPPAV